MKTLSVWAAIVMVGGIGPALAQGLPPGSAPVYGSHAFPQTQVQPGSVLSQRGDSDRPAPRARHWAADTSNANRTEVR
jgi:hypothetical protein